MRSQLQLKVSKTTKAVLPSYANPDDAGLDLTAVTMKVSDDGRYVEYGTGLVIEIPPGHVGLLFPRSSVSKYDLMLANCVGVVDAGYRGEVKLRFRRLPRLMRWGQQCLGRRKEYPVGERVGQLMVIPVPTVVVIEEECLSKTVRGDGGFGSSG